MGAHRKHTTMRPLFLFLLIALSFSLTAQEQNYLEVTVTDSVALIPGQVTYEVSTGKTMDLFGMKIPLGDDNDGDDKPDLGDWLKKNKIAHTKQASKYELTKKEAAPVYLINVSMGELDGLMAKLAGFEGLEGKISRIEHATPKNMRSNSYERLAKKAREEADLLAASLGRKVGTIMHVYEKPSQVSTYLDAFQSLSKLIPKLFGGSVALEKYYVKQMVYRFELM